MEAPIAEIKPDIKKAFLLNIMVVAGIVALIIASLIYLNSIVGLGIFLDTFREFGIVISAYSLLAYSIITIVLVTILILILNYVTLGKMSYTLYPDRVSCSQSLFIMQLKEESIPYANISKITYKKNFLGASKISIELTGMKKAKADMDFIDDAEEVVKQLQELVQNYRATYYARYSRDYRYQGIMDKY